MDKQLDNISSFGEYIDIKREMFGYTLKELSERVGVNASYLTRLIKEPNRSPSFEIVMKIATELKMDFRKILKLFGVETNLNIEKFSIFNKTISIQEKELLEHILNNILRITKKQVMEWKDIQQVINKIEDLNKIRKEDVNEMYYIVPLDEDSMQIALETSFITEELIVLFLNLIVCRTDKYIVCKEVILGGYSTTTILDILKEAEEITENDVRYDVYAEFVDYINSLKK